MKNIHGYLNWKLLILLSLEQVFVMNMLNIMNYNKLCVNMMKFLLIF